MGYELMRHPSAMAGARLGATPVSVQAAPASASPLQLMSDANARCAALLKPLWPAIDQLPITPEAKSTLKAAPVEGLLLIFWPLDQLARDIIERAAYISGGMYTVGLGPMQRRVKIGPKKKTVQSPETDAASACPNGVDDLRIFQALDAHLPQEQRDTLQRLRVVVSYMVLVMKDPLVLAQSIVAVFTERGIQGADIAADAARRLGAQAQATVDTFVDAGKAAADAAKQAAQAKTQADQAKAVAAAQAAQDKVNAGAAKTAQTTNTVTQNVLRRVGLGGLSGLGVLPAVAAGAGGGAAATTAATGTTATAATTGVVLTPELVSLIVGLTGAGLKSAPALVTAASGAAGAAASAGKPPKTQTTAGNNAANITALQQQGIVAKPSMSLSPGTMQAAGAAALLGLGFFVMKKTRKNPHRKNAVRVRRTTLYC